MAKKSSELFGTISLSDITKPKKMVTQKIRINGLLLEIARPSNSKKLPSKFKSLI